MEKTKKISMFGVVFFVLLLLVVLYHQQQNEVELSRYEATFFDVFNTRTDIIVYHTGEDEYIIEQVGLLKEKLEYYHKLYDIYNDYEGVQNIKTINDNAGVAPVMVSEDIINLLIFSKEMYEQTNGQINIAMGSVLKIWHHYRDAGTNTPETAVLPPMGVLEEASVHCDINQIIIDEEAMTVYLADENMSIDVGSIGKGYAAQRVAEYAKELGMESVLLNVGCNVCAVGSKPDGNAWRVGIQNPDLESDEAYVRTVDVSDACIVTSGNYQRYYVVNGERYCHIIDGDTLMPADYFASVSIIAKDSGMADALSTSVFNMPFEEGVAFVNGFDGVEAMWILNDGSIEYSEGFKEYVAD